MQGAANNPGAEAAQIEREEEEKEKNVEEDDEETLQKARNWDDWKDGQFYVSDVISLSNSLVVAGIHFLLMELICMCHLDLKLLALICLSSLMSCRSQERMGQYA